jgi:predicted LPLAT superfamily acyltransferase
LTRERSWTDTEERGRLSPFRVMVFLNRIYVLNWWIARGLMYLIVTFYFLTDAEKRGHSRQYLERLTDTEMGRELLGHEPNLRDVYRHFLEFGKGIFNRVSLWLGYESWYEVKEVPSDARDDFYEYARSDQGGLLLSFHVGHFDIMRFMALKQDITINVVWYEDNTPVMNDLLKEVDPASHLNIVEVDPDNPQSMIQLQDHIDRGEFVAVLGDRASVGATSRTATVDFLGETTELPVGPYVLASLLECPVIVSYTLRNGYRSYEIHAERFAESVSLPRENREDVLADHAQRYARIMEKACFKAPYQWFNFYDYWADR